MLQAILSGLVLGSIYALIAQGYYVTYITTNTMNFGQGDYLMLGAMVGLTLTAAGAPLWVTIVAVLVVLGLAGIAMEYLAIRPLRHFHSIGWILSTVAIAIIVRNIAMLVWGRNVLPFPSPFGSTVLRFGPLSITAAELFMVTVSALVMGALFIFLRRSLFGKALQAVAFNRDAASLMGINPRMMAVISYTLSGALAGLGGVLVAPITNAAFFMGAALGLKAFTAAIIGGLDNPIGILVGGLSIGAAEAIVARFASQWKDAAAFVLILIVLVATPQGLFGKRVREKF